MKTGVWIGSLWALLLASCPLAAPAPSLNMVYFNDFAPYSWRDEQGKMRGIMVDVMDRVAAELGIRVTHQGYPWLRAPETGAFRPGRWFCNCADPRAAGLYPGG